MDGRTIVGLVCVGFAALALLAAQFAPPLVTWAIIALGAAFFLFFRRQLYGAAKDGSPGVGWERTDERFIDDTTGQLVEVWVNPKTGARDYRTVTDRRS